MMERSLAWTLATTSTVFNVSDALRSVNETEVSQQFVGEAMSVSSVALLGSLHALSIVNGVLGNSLLLMVLCTDKPFHMLPHTYRVYLVNLVLADLYILAYYFPLLLAAYILGRYPAANHTHCVVTAFWASVSYVAFLSTLLLISLDRYLRVSWVGFYNAHFTVRKKSAWCVITWVVGVLTALSKLLSSGFEFNPKIYTCQFKDAKTFKSNHATLESVMSVTIFAYIVLNSLLYRSIRRTRQLGLGVRRRAGCCARFPFGADIALLRSVFVLFLCLLLCLSSSTAVRIAADFVDVPVEAYSVVALMMSLNCSVSWMVCGLTNARFRYGYKRVLLRCVHSKEQ